LDEGIFCNEYNLEQFAYNMGMGLSLRFILLAWYLLAISHISLTFAFVHFNSYKYQSTRNLHNYASGKGFQKQNESDKTIKSKPNTITASQGSQNPQLEKFLMMYTCKICTGRNAHMVSKVAYNYGMVVASCRHCKNKHLIADNEKKMGE
jgi:hypothetical protein